jgi:uncharacterized protein (DUF433 family)
MRSATKSKPFSIRLSRPTDLYVTAEARRTKRSKGAIVEALTEEAARMHRFAGIAFRGEGPYREEWVVGTGLDVWEIIEMLHDYGSVEKLLEGNERLSARAVDLALAYYEHYRDEIDDKIAQNRRPPSELRDLYPFAHFSPRVAAAEDR